MELLSASLVMAVCHDSRVFPSSETQGQIVGPKTKIKTGGKKFDEQKYERKIRAPGDKLFTHQFQTAERILAADWAEKFSAQSAASIHSAVWNWCVKSLSLGARIFLSYFCSAPLSALGSPRMEFFALG